MDLLPRVSQAMRKHADLLSERITPHQQAALKAFVQQEQTAGYAPQSGEIFGIMQAMKEDFERNLAESQKTEAQQIASFEDLKSAKTEEIEAGTEQIDAKTEELAATDEKNSASKKDLEDTTATLAEDTKFLADLKDKCANADQEYEERVKTRNLEMTAVSKALEYLSSDEAHELFTRTFNPALVQMRSLDSQQAKRRKQAVQLLQRAAAHDPRLSTLAVHAQMDAFANLKKTIQTM